MSTFLRKEAALKTELHQLTRKLTQVETAIEKAKNDKDYFIRWFRYWLYSINKLPNSVTWLAIQLDSVTYYLLLLTDFLKNSL